MKIVTAWLGEAGFCLPIYEYQCVDCEYRFEQMQSVSAPPVTKCPACGGKVSQLLSAPAVQFKGSGWYVTDYARKSSAPSPTGDGAKPPQSKSETKSEAPKAPESGSSKEK